MPTVDILISGELGGSQPFIKNLEVTFVMLKEDISASGELYKFPLKTKQTYELCSVESKRDVLAHDEFNLNLDNAPMTDVSSIQNK